MLTKLKGVKNKMLSMRKRRKNSRVHAVMTNGSSKVLPKIKIE